MAQNHEMSGRGFEVPKLTDWKIDPSLSDTEILEHLDSVRRPFKSPPITVEGGTLINGELILSFRKISNGFPRLFVSRRSEVPIISRKGDLIISKYSVPRDTDFSTAPLRSSGEIVGHIGDKYAVNLIGVRHDQDLLSCDVVVASTQFVHALNVPGAFRDHHVLLNSMERRLGKPPRIS